MSCISCRERTVTTGGFPIDDLILVDLGRPDCAPDQPSQAVPGQARDRQRQDAGYRYLLAEPIGRNLDPEFKPELTPKEMLALGVFGGKYMTDCRMEFPSSWFTRAKLSPEGRNDTLNYFGVDASQPLSVWRRNGWLHDDDPRGWFQWYCRYFMGRRIPGEDMRQIKRWKAFRRHIAQIRQNCEPDERRNE